MCKSPLFDSFEKFRPSPQKYPKNWDILGGGFVNIDLKKYKKLRFLILGGGRICEGGQIPARLR